MNEDKIKFSTPFIRSLRLLTFNHELPAPVFGTARDEAKEALIKSDVQIAPSNFSSDCAKAAQESWRISSSFCAIWRKICK